jgi:hypothetical protein
MIAKVLAKYQALPALSQKVSGTMSIFTEGVDIKATFKTHMQMARGNRFKVDASVTFAGTTVNGTVVSDGKTVWDVDNDAKTYSEQEFEQVNGGNSVFTDWMFDRAAVDMAMLAFLDASGFPGFKGVDPSKLGINVKNYPTQTVNGRKQYVVKVPVEITSENGQKVDARFYVDAKDLLIRRAIYKIAQKTGDGKSMRIEFAMQYTEIRPAARASAVDFQYTAPDNFQQVAEIKGAFDRAFNRK